MLCGVAGIQASRTVLRNAVDRVRRADGSGLAGSIIIDSSFTNLTFALCLITKAVRHCWIVQVPCGQFRPYAVVHA